MKRFAAILMLATALSTPLLAQAREVKISATLNDYGGPGAYLAVYVTKPDGSFAQTLWVSGQKVRYLGELRGWAAAASAAGAVNIDGISGASVGSGQTLEVTAELVDAMIDAGYVVHVDTAVEHGGAYADDAVAPLVSAPQTVEGTGYVKTLAIAM